MTKSNLLVVLLLILILGAVYFFSKALGQIFFSQPDSAIIYEDEYDPSEPEPTLPASPPTPEEKAARQELRNSDILPGTVGDKLLNFLLSGKRDFSRELYEVEYPEFDAKQQPVDSLLLELSELAKVMQAYQNLKIEVVAHTSGIGDWDTQQKISGQRADHIKAYLVKQGLNSKRITTTGYGATYPIADVDTERGRQMNERIEIVIRRL